MTTRSAQLGPVALAAVSLLGTGLLSPGWVFGKYPNLAAALARGEATGAQVGDASPAYLLLHLLTSPLFVRWLQAGVAALTVAVLFHLLHRQAGARGAWLGAGALALAQPWLVYSAVMEPDLPHRGGGGLRRRLARGHAHAPPPRPGGTGGGPGGEPAPHHAALRGPGAGLAGGAQDSGARGGRLRGGGAGHRRAPLADAAREGRAGPAGHDERGAGLSPIAPARVARLRRHLSLAAQGGRVAGDGERPAPARLRARAVPGAGARERAPARGRGVRGGVLARARPGVFPPRAPRRHRSVARQGRRLRRPSLGRVRRSPGAAVAGPGGGSALALAHPAGGRLPGAAAAASLRSGAAVGAALGGVAAGGAALLLPRTVRGRPGAHPGRAHRPGTRSTRSLSPRGGEGRGEG